MPPTDDEPRFEAIARSDPDVRRAHEQAAESIERFREFAKAPDGRRCWAKLRFRDPDLSDEIGEDCFLFLWLYEVRFHDQDGVFAGTLLEVPQGLREYLSEGERLVFEPDEVFDWVVIEDGLLRGGFTLRVTRDRLPEPERAEFDVSLGATAWEDLDASDA